MFLHSDGQLVIVNLLINRALVLLRSLGIVSAQFLLSTFQEHIANHPGGRSGRQTGHGGDKRRDF